MCLTGEKIPSTDRLGHHEMLRDAQFLDQAWKSREEFLGVLKEGGHANVQATK